MIKTHCRLLTAFALLCLTNGCQHAKPGFESQQGNFTRFIAQEIKSVGGNSTKLKSAKSVYGNWTCRREEQGSLILLSGPSFADVKQTLQGAYGEPKVYVPANQKRGAWFLFPKNSVGAGVAMAELPDQRMEITCTRFLKLE